jgi:hypothetical protein
MPRRRARTIYWQTVLPGSKRYLGGGQMIVDDSDVRPPQGDDVWKGAVVGGYGSGGSHTQKPAQRVTLAMDGVFFADGQFAGPNRGMLWEQVVSQAEAVLCPEIVAVGMT